MADIFLKSTAGAGLYATGVKTLGQKIVPTTGDVSANVALARAWVWECTTAGTTNGAITWPAAVTQDVTTVTQNSVVFTARKPGYSSGSTRDWSFSTILLDYALLAAAQLDYVRVSNHHAESVAGLTRNYTSVGAFSAPVFVTVVDDSLTSGWTGTAGPITITAGAGGAMTFNGHTLYDGIQFDNAGNFTFNSSGNQCKLVFKNGGVRITGSGASSVNIGNGTPVSEVEWVNMTMRFGATTQRMVALKCKFTWTGGSWVAGGSTPTSIFTATSAASDANVELNGVDLSALGAAVNIVQSTPTTSLKILLNRVKMPGSWTGGLFSGSPNSIAGLRGEMHNCVSATSDLPQKYIEDAFGTLRSNVIVTRTGDGSDESWQMAASPNAVYPGFYFRSPWSATPNTVVGTPQNLAIYCVTNSATAPTNAELNVEIQVRSTSGSPLASAVDDAPADSVAAAVTQTADTSVWTANVPARVNSTAYVAGDVISVSSNPDRPFFCTTGGTSAASLPAGYATAVDGDAITDGTAVFRSGWRQKLDITFTAQETGFILYRVCMSKQGQTVIVDRLPVVT